MPQYTLKLDEGQLDLLHSFLTTGVEQLQKDIRKGAHHPDPRVHADMTLDAFSRGPRLVAFLEEHKALGPEPAMEE